jgi:hypothetical protein
VIKRKLAYGSETVEGAEAYTSALSVIASARLQDMNPYEFISDYLHAAANGEELPTLV